ncbi:hypothetical protein VM1G_07057 [Cytospora mali]|uniref:Uncharacterized protein n=1 Tax=Cytospora mali TaxID=578113 RepID=A0A194W5U8_CYTMA|nr:hypothetical protein VM1G_07057 [Valsa mali]
MAIVADSVFFVMSNLAIYIGVTLSFAFLLASLFIMAFVDESSIRDTSNMRLSEHTEGTAAHIETEGSPMPHNLENINLNTDLKSSVRSQNVIMALSMFIVPALAINTSSVFLILWIQRRFSVHQTVIDLRIIRFSLVFLIVGTVLVAITTDFAFMLVALAIFAAGFVLRAPLLSYTTSLVQPQLRGRLYGIIQIVESLGYLVTWFFLRMTQSLGSPQASTSVARSNTGTGPGEGNPCGTVTSYNLIVETVGPTDTQTVYDTVTITVSASTSTQIPTSGVDSGTTASSLTTTSSTPLTTTSLNVNSSPTRTTSSAIAYSTTTSTATTTTISSRSSSSTPCVQVSTPCVIPNTFYLQATGVSTASGSSTNTLLPRANCQYATLYDAKDGYADDFLTFSQPGRDIATTFTLDSQSRLVSVVNSYTMIVYKSGTSNQAYFSGPNVVASFASTYGAANCSISASDCSLSCAYGVQKYTSICFGSANNTIDANGHLYLSGNVASQGNNCRAVKPIVVAAGTGNS